MTGERADGRTPINQAWARGIARGLDGVILTPLFWVAMNWVDGPWPALTPPEAYEIISLQAMAVATAMVLIFEPVFLAGCGATPGKWLMGVRVLRAGDRRMTYRQALARAGLVVILGLALFLPLAIVITTLLQFARVSDGQSATWDTLIQSSVAHRQRHPLVWGLLGAVVVATPLVQVWLFGLL